MTMKKNDKQIENTLKNMQAPAIDQQAKKRAVNLAMAAFEEQQNEGNQKSSQGFAQWLRPIGEITTQIRRLLMNAINNKVIYSALGSVCVAVLCFGLITSMMPRVTEEQLLGAASERAEEGITLKKESREKEVVLLEHDLFDNSRQTAPASQPQASAALEMNSPRKPEVNISRGRVLEEMIATSKPNIDALNNTASRPNAKTIRAQTLKAKDVSKGAITKHDISIYNPQQQNRDQFEKVEQNPIKQVAEEPVSTFSVDVDTSSYSFVRRQLNNGYLPQKAAVRVEEMINYFDYKYDVPETREQPFKPTVYVTPTPWNKHTQLIHIGIKGYEIQADKKPDSNLVFLLDVSGSMNNQDKLPLVKQSMALLLDTLNPDDTISIVVYAGAAGTVLEPTKVKEKRTILSALNRLQAGGSTAGAQGIKLAYELAEANFDKEAINRVILATDGDFNVGITDNDQLQSFIERKRDKGIFLSVLGFGQGNYQDDRMQTLAQNGNGVAAYIDTLSEAQKVLVNEASSMLFPIAKDVKIQVEFNPDTVSEYRLIGYETRHLNREDFNNDKVDAGDIGAGHTVTAIYEITPADSKNKAIDKNRYQQKAAAKNDDFSNEYAFLKIRYKLPNENESKLVTQPIIYSPLLKQKANKDVEFATAVAAFAQILKGGKYTGDYNYSDVIKLANRNKGVDDYGYRSEFIQIVRKAKIANDMAQ